jgi:hypothetical protein
MTAPLLRCRWLPGLAAAGFIVFAACSDIAEPPRVTPPAPPQPPPPVEPPRSEPPVYSARPPAGLLPWPHHDPAWDSATYAAKLDSLWVINNFGAYTGTADRSVLYLHDAWDLVLPNGTPIYAVTAGTVVAHMTGNPFYETMIIEDADKPGYAWGYTHVHHWKARLGDRVHQGTELGAVNFQGLEDIHLARYKLMPGGRWNDMSSIEVLHPDGYFHYIDTKPPVFEGRFRYVRNMTDSPFTPAADDVPAVVRGDVDIVVGLRDPGEWTESRVPYAGIANFGGAQAVTRIEYDIANEAGDILLSALAFDLSLIRIVRPNAESRAMQLLTLFQHYESALPRPPAGWATPRFNFYVITNSHGAERTEPYRLASGDVEHAWQTAARRPDGSPRFPNGIYTVTIRARDSAGNSSSRSEPVRVDN